MPVITDQDVNSQLEAAANAPAKDDAPHPLAAPAKEPSFLEKWMAPVQHATTSMIDSAVSAAEQIYRTPMPGAETTPEQVGNKVRDVASGLTTGAVNTADAGMSAAKTLVSPLMGPEAGAQVAAMSPIWEHAKQHILDFRDAMAVKDPSVMDSLTQGVAQLAIPFAGYSRALAGVHGLANVLASGAMVDATALAPHDMRTADLLALGQKTEGKLGEVLRAAGPYGLNAYISYLADRTNETEAQGRFKNVLDGLGVNMVLTPLLHAAGVTLKAGQTGLRYMAENGIRNTISDMAAPMKVGRSAQLGHIAFHGSPHDFDAFDTSAIGTGQGAQSFGHGLYFAENSSVAGNYAQRFTNTNLTRADLKEYYKPGETRDLSNGTKDKITGYDPKTGLVDVLRTDRAGQTSYPVQYRDTSADWLRVRQALGQPLSKNGKMYTADIGDEHVAKMLDWDAPLTKQPAEVITALHQAGVPLRAGMTGEEAYNELIQRAQGGQKAASEFLSKAGVPGIKYLDQGSRGKAGEGTRNIVLFDAKHAKIIAKGEAGA